MTFTLKTVLLAGCALTVLAGCGLRGGLERPDPIFKDVKPVEAVVEPAPEVEVRVRPRTNELGGELPLPAPVEEVETAPLPDVQP
jgi:predicted small lipoprotein YifL